MTAPNTHPAAIRDRHNHHGAHPVHLPTPRLRHRKGRVEQRLVAGRQRRWEPSRLAAGALVGIAATERHGGSRIHEISTSASLTDGGRWLLSGEESVDLPAS